MPDSPAPTRIIDVEVGEARTPTQGKPAPNQRLAHPSRTNKPPQIRSIQKKFTIFTIIFNNIDNKINFSIDIVNLL